MDSSHQVIEGVQDHLVQHGGAHDYSRLHDRNGQPSWRKMSKGVLAVTEQLAPWSRDIFIFHFRCFFRDAKGKEEGGQQENGGWTGPYK